MAEPAVPQVITVLVSETHSLEKWGKLSSLHFLPFSQEKKRRSNFKGDGFFFFQALSMRRAVNACFSFIDPLLSKCAILFLLT